MRKPASAEFTLLREQTGATDGNLSAHLRKLEDADYITVEKSFVRRKPVSRYALAAQGRKALAAYVERLEALISKGGP